MDPYYTLRYIFCYISKIIHDTSQLRYLSVKRRQITKAEDSATNKGYNHKSESLLLQIRNSSHNLAVSQPHWSYFCMKVVYYGMDFSC
jgi:hypothetical protein